MPGRKAVLALIRSFFILGGIMRNRFFAFSLVAGLAVAYSAPALAASVSISTPADGSTVSSPVPVRATASGETSPIGKMQVYDNSSLVYETLTASSTLDTSVTLSPGVHALQVKAWYNNGSSVIDNASVTVSASAPAVSISAPAAGATVTSPVTVTATASGETSPIGAMQIYDNGNMVYATPGPATTLDQSVTLADGNHALQVKAWYNNGSSVAANENITVQPSAAPAVTITAPADGASVTSPVTVTANATGVTNPGNMQIYDNGTMVWETPSPTTTLNHSQALSNGAHALTVKSWYGNPPNNSVMSTVNVTASPGTGNPPPGSVTFDFPYYLSAATHNPSLWNECGTCANSNPGSGATVNYIISSAANPTGSGSTNVLKFNLAQVNGPYADGYAWVENGARSALVDYVSISMDMYIPTQFANTKQQIEFEAQQNIGNQIYDLAWGANYKASGKWCTWNYGASKWEPTPIPNTLTAGVWHHIVATGHFTAGQVHYDDLVVDGATNNVNTMQPSATNSKGTSNKFTNAIQLDSDSSSDPYYIYIDNLKVVVHP